MENTPEGRNALNRLRTFKERAERRLSRPVSDPKAKEFKALYKEADELASDFSVRFPDYKLHPTAGGPLAANVADERLIKSWINGYLLQYQKNGWVKNVEANQDNLIVTISTVTTGRASAKIPVDVIDLFAQLDADLYQVG